MTATGTSPALPGLPGRVWLYANYHCNLACTYCLTDSAPSSPRRTLPADRMVAVARQAAELGFTALGVTGGEPFLRPDMPATLARLAEFLPTVVLSNATLFGGNRIERLRPLVGSRVAVQVSLDSADAGPNDVLRAGGNHATVVETIPRLVALGVTVRVATTVDPARPDRRGRPGPPLCPPPLPGRRRRGPRGPSRRAPGPGRRLRDGSGGRDR